MCKNCGNCSTEHGGRTIDDAMDEVIDSTVQSIDYTAYIRQNRDMAKKIQFSRYDDTQAVYLPGPSTKFIPDWYKDAKSYLNDEKSQVQKNHFQQ